MIEHFDLVIVGAGQSGPSLGAAMAGRGQRVAIVEARELGGTCVNRGCTPTKALRKSARVAHMARRAREFGVETGEVRVDVAAAMDRVQRVVNASRNGLETWLAGVPTLTIVRGHARLDGRDGDAFNVVVGDRVLRAPRVALNTGTRPVVPPIPGIESVPYLTNENVLALRECPRHLIVLGGSYIGLEFGQIFRRLGSDVTIIETSARVASREDADVSSSIAQFLRDEGITIHTKQSVVAVERAGDADVLVRCEDVVATGSHLLIATGRTPNTAELGLETIGLATDRRGYISTNGRLETAVPGVWALGDINGRGAFTHTSYHDHEILVANWNGGTRSADDRVMTYAMFTDPPLGHVGLYEADARRLVDAGRRISQAVYEMSRVSRAKEESETNGLVKLLVDEDSGRFLGATIVGINADEVVQLIGQVMAAGGTWRTVREALPIHPTISEYLPTILDARRPLAASVPA